MGVRAYPGYRRANPSQKASTAVAAGEPAARSGDAGSAARSWSHRTRDRPPCEEGAPASTSSRCVRSRQTESRSTREMDGGRPRCRSWGVAQPQKRRRALGYPGSEGHTSRGVSARQHDPPGRWRRGSPTPQPARWGPLDPSRDPSYERDPDDHRSRQLFADRPGRGSCQ